MYNINTQRILYYESIDEIKIFINLDFSENVIVGYGKFDLYVFFKYEDYRKLVFQGYYGSLERNIRRRDRWLYRDRQFSDSDSIVLFDFEFFKFGSKRNFQSEYDLVLIRSSVIEVFVKYEEIGTLKY